MSRLSCNIPLFSWYDTNPGTPSFSKSSINELVSAILTDITNTFQVGFFFNTSRIACDFPEPIGAVHNTVHFLCFCPLFGISSVTQSQLILQKEGYEGGIVRQDMPYQVDKRNKALLKVKFFMDEEFQIVNFTDGDTPSSKGLVKWVVMTPEGKIFNVSMNAPHELQREYFQNGEKYIGSDLTVEFETYSPDGIPMKPRGKAIRNYE